MSERRLRDLGDVAVTEQEAGGIQQLIEDTEQSYAAEARVFVSWSPSALAVIRRAADLHGVPYETYVKQVAYRQALTDLRDAAVAGVAPSGSDTP